MNLEDLINKDIDKILKSNIPLNSLENSTILITGATGLIGSLIIKTILRFSHNNNISIKIIGLVRNLQKANIIFKDCDDSLIFVCQDICNELNIPYSVDYIIHGASITSSADFVTKPVDTLKVLYQGTLNILNFAYTKRTKSIVLLSSLEVYGSFPLEKCENISENEYGYLDPIAVRSSYSEGKRIMECLCAAFTSQYHIPVKIARLSQTFGPGVAYNDQRVFAEFARNAIEGNDIILHTKGETVRNYCYTMDAVSAIFFILFYGIQGNAYNVANDSTVISIYQLATLIKDISNSSIQIKIELSDPEKYGYNPVTKTILNTEKLKTLGWIPQYNLREMLYNLIEGMKAK